ncbi:unnamed protein product, partial [Prorocentrum cordatum]
ANCRKAAKLENEDMGGSWEEVPPLGSGAPAPTTRPPTSTRLTLRPMPPSARLIQHRDTRGNMFHAVEGSELGKSMKRLADTFLLEHLPTWEMWSSKLLQQWTMCRRWGRVIMKVFLKTIDRVTWKLDSIGLHVQLRPEKCPTWPAELEQRAKIEPCRPRAEAKQRSAASAAAREQNQELRATIETAKCDFSTKYATVDAFAALSSEQIYEKLNMETAKKKPDTKKVETVPTVVCPAIPARYAQMCQRPDCQQQRGIAKNEPIVKAKPFGWRHQACGSRAKDSNLGQVCDEKGDHCERLGLFNDCDLSKPQGYHKAKFLLDEKRPELLVSTPPCGPWSIMQNVNQRDDKQKENLRRERLKSQRIFENNKRFIEHQVLHLNGSALAQQPRNSRSWQKTCWKDLHNILPCEVIVDGCACGLRAPDTGELMKKRWKFLANDEDETYIPPLDGKESHNLTSDTVKKLESYIRLVHANLGHLPQNVYEVLFDAFSWIRRSANANVMALAILDAGLDMLCARLVDEKATPGTRRRYDPAGSAISDEFREWIESHGANCLPCAADAHWQIGKIERAIEAFKEALDAIDEIDGFSPLQRYAGRTPTGTAVNLFDEPSNLPLISAELLDGTFSRGAQVRRGARLAHIQTENSDRVKRAESARFRSFKKYETGGSHLELGARKDKTRPEEN